ncbi:hypothetical protein DLJ49_18720 [Rhodovulum sp. 12E13]|nr:hypothetical protein DLJ49_18720 [Rhodovulum sp. 12E13]
MRKTVALLALALAACARPDPEVIRLPPERVLVSPPRLLLECADAPAVPDAETQRAVAEYLVRLESAGADCRDKLRAVREFIERESADG